MAAPAKFTTFFGMMGKPEASYGSGATLAGATDGILLEEWGQVKPDFANKGERSMAAWTRGYQRKVGASGEFLKFTSKVAMRGGAAYGSSSPQSSLRTLLRCSGFDVTVTTTPGAEKEVYTPTVGPSGYASGGYELYGRGEKAVLIGGLSDFSIDCPGPVVPVWSFATSAIVQSITDSAVPSITYPNFDPPKAVNIAFTATGLGTLVVRSWKFKLGRVLSPRVDINAVGNVHAGFGPGRWTPQLSMVIETPLISTTDLVGVFANATQFGSAWALQVGSVQYSKFHLGGGGFLQLLDVPTPQDDGAVATHELTFQCNPDSIGATNDLVITLD